VDRVSSYVQCDFGDHDREMLCEGASGYYAPPGEGPRFTPDNLGGLAQLGFAMHVPRQNFQKFLKFGPEPDLDAIARLLLSALYVGYDARLGTAVVVEAPLATRKGILRKNRCYPIS
jgi:hypothetical protein